MVRTVYVVWTPILWDQMTVQGKKLNTEKVGFAFLPIFRSERIAKKCFPGHIIMPMEYEDDPEVFERPPEGRGHTESDGSSDVHSANEG